MKTQIFGCSLKPYPLAQRLFSIPPYGGFPFWVPVLPVAEDAWFAARLRYRKNRENGADIDNPLRSFPEDGGCYWEEDRSLRNTRGHAYWSRAHYYQGSEDKKWMEEKDKNYLARIESKGALKKLEPAIWYLCEKEHVTNINIKIWWEEKLKLSNLPQILKQAEQRMKEGLLGFLEGMHERLGVNSPVNILPKELVLQISELTCGKKILVTDFFKQIAPASSAQYRQYCLACSIQ